jgi:hypothetical protein
VFLRAGNYETSILDIDAFVGFLSANDLITAAPKGGG